MKFKITAFTLVAFMIFSGFYSKAQSTFPNTKFPMVTKDFTFDNPVNAFGKHVITLDGAWGFGINYTYLKPKLVFASVEAGYGWVIAAHKKYPQEDFKSKKWRPWLHASVGYPVFTFERGVKGRFVTEHTTNSEGKEV